jgi:hypothetical protein
VDLIRFAERLEQALHRTLFDYTRLIPLIGDENDRDVLADAT